jgi:hypothetical protein
MRVQRCALRANIDPERRSAVRRRAAALAEQGQEGMGPAEQRVSGASDPMQNADGTAQLTLNCIRD